MGLGCCRSGAVYVITRPFTNFSELRRCFYPRVSTRDSALTPKTFAHLHQLPLFICRDTRIARSIN